MRRVFICSQQYCHDHIIPSFDQKPFSSRHSVYDAIQEGNRSVDPRCSRLCIAKLIVHMDAHTFAIPVDDVRTLSFAKWYLTSRPILSTPREIGSNARTRYPEVSGYRNAEGLFWHGLYIYPMPRRLDKYSGVWQFFFAKKAFCARFARQDVKRKRYGNFEMLKKKSTRQTFSKIFRVNYYKIWFNFNEFLRSKVDLFNFTFSLTTRNVIIKIKRIPFNRDSIQIYENSYNSE